MRSQGLLELGKEGRSAEVRRKLDCPPHFRDHFDSGDQTFVGQFSLQLEQLLILLVIRAVFGVRQLPSDEVLVTLVPVGPAVPLVSALVHDMDDLVQKLWNLGSQGVSDVDEAVDAHNQEDRVNSVARNHDFQLSIS
jgi:hypothetical protein